tara:strand:+ start:2050 stop:2682 length:633 start_codon:yes stop_codon:yes gene_type:complete
MKILVFDTETTGLPIEKNPSIYETNKWPYILQLSYVIYDLKFNNIVKKFDKYINISDEVEISQESQNVHKITREVCKKGDLIGDILNEFKKDMDECDLLVGHNVSFDKRMIIVEGIRNKINMNLKPTYCTMKNSVDICKIERKGENDEMYYKFPTLNELHNKLFNKELNKIKLHNALVDVIVCLKCYVMMEEKENIQEKNREIRSIFRNL